MDKVKKYLDKAAECLEQAAAAPPDLKAALIDVAEQYTRLAEFAAREREGRADILSEIECDDKKE
jgi:hypothetical protein